MDSQDAKKGLQKQLNAGASSLVLLSFLAQQNRAMYGYAIAKALEEQASGALPMKSGALYPVLRSLEKQGLLDSFLDVSQEGRSRKYYRITAAGKKVLPQWTEAWRETQQFVNTFVEKANVDSRRRRSSSVSRQNHDGSAKRTRKPA